MKTKEEIVANWLPATDEKLENFGSHILLTNFSNYLTYFAEMAQHDDRRCRKTYAMCYSG